MTEIKRSRTRRRVQMRSVFLLCAAAFVLKMSIGGTLRLLGLPQTSFTEPLMRAATGLLCFGLPAYLGLFVLDGDHRELLADQQLGRGAILPLVLTGMLMVCPAILLQELNERLTAVVGQTFSGEAEMPMKLTAVELKALGVASFLPMALETALLAPILEEVFFRGYLMSALMRFGRREAIFLSACLFALIHGISPALPGYLVLGCLLGAVVLHTGSLFAAMIVHSMYNLTLLAGSYLGLFPDQMNPFFAAALLAGILLLVRCLSALWKARRPRMKSIFMKSIRLNRRDVRRVAAAVLALLLLVPASEWMTYHWTEANEWISVQQRMKEEKGGSK